MQPTAVARIGIFNYNNFSGIFWLRTIDRVNVNGFLDWVQWHKFPFIDFTSRGTFYHRFNCFFSILFVLMKDPNEKQTQRVTIIMCCCVNSHGRNQAKQVKNDKNTQCLY